MTDGLRDARNKKTEAFLLERTEENKTAMQHARARFGQWHTVSLLLNFATIFCVAAAMAMAGNLESGATMGKKEEATEETPKLE